MHRLDRHLRIGDRPPSAYTGTDSWRNRDYLPELGHAVAIMTFRLLAALPPKAVYVAPGARI